MGELPERLRCEFALIRYVPDAVKGEFANIGVVLRGADGGAAVRFTRDWTRVRCLDPHADTEMLEGFEADIAAQMERGVDPLVNSKPILELLQDTLSNSVQVTETRATLAVSFVTEMEQLLRMYVQPLQVAGAAKRRPRGRTAILQTMRTEFERVGVWDLLRKRIAAAQYTRAGDPMKLDLGYRHGTVRLFQAVTLEGDVDGAKSLAFSMAALRAGVERVDGVALEMTAVVEPISRVNDEEMYRFGVSAMEQEQIRVLTVADLGRVAATAQRELRG